MRLEWYSVPLTREARTGNRTRIICLEGRCAGHYTTFSKAAPTGIEPVSPDRQSGILTSILWSYDPARDGEGINKTSQISFHLRFLHFRTKKPPVFSDKRQSLQSKLFLSVHSSMCTEALGPRFPLNPALLKHALLNRSALSAEGIIIPGRLHGRYTLPIFCVCICSIAFPLRTCSPVFSTAHYNMWKWACH